MTALVQGGATLGQAGRVYGLGRERVRQILKEEGTLARRQPSRIPSGPRLPRDHPLALAVEALWRGGMLLREAAEVLAMPHGLARELLCERVPREQRVARNARKFDGREVPVEQMLAALREAAELLGGTPARSAYERLRGQGLLEGPAGGYISHRLGWAQACELATLHPPTGT